MPITNKSQQQSLAWRHALPILAVWKPFSSCHNDPEARWCVLGALQHLWWEEGKKEADLFLMSTGYILFGGSVENLVSLLWQFFKSWRALNKANTAKMFRIMTANVREIPEKRRMNIKPSSRNKLFPFTLFERREQSSKQCGCTCARTAACSCHGEIWFPVLSSASKSNWNHDWTLAPVSPPSWRNNKQKLLNQECAGVKCPVCVCVCVLYVGP